MRRVLFIITFITAFQFSNGQYIENPGEYITAVANAQTEMNQKYMAYVSAASHGRRARKVEKLRKAALESIDKCKYKTIDLPFYKGDKTLRQASLDYIQLCYNIFNDDYAKIVNMEEIAEQSFDEMQAYLLLQEKTSEKLKEASEKMNKAEKDFAAKYNVNLIEGSSELGDKMKVAGQLNRYHNEVFLVFFKCNWQDNAIIKAINAKKLNDAEQARNALIKYANEGLAVLDTMKGFQGDKSLVNACRSVLQFYKRIAENDIPKITEYFLKEENFNKMKKAVETKAAPTKEEIDAYNKAVKDINAAVNTFNQTNSNLANMRKQQLENWESASKSFMDNHMPYYKK
jgi:hypothetical protein